MGDPAEKLNERLVIDGDELERIASDAVREVPAHLVASEIRRRLRARAEQMKKTEDPIARERARKIAEKLVRR